MKVSNKSIDEKERDKNVVSSHLIIHSHWKKPYQRKEDSYKDPLRKA